MSPMDRPRIRKPSNPEGSPHPSPPLPSPSGDITVESQVAQGSTFTIWLPIRQDGSGVYPDEPDRALAAPHPSSSEDEDYAVPASRPQPAASKGGAVRWGESHGPRQHIQAWKQIYHTVSLAPHNRDSTSHHSLHVLPTYGQCPPPPPSRIPQVCPQRYPGCPPAVRQRRQLACHHREWFQGARQAGERGRRNTQYQYSTP